MIEYFFQCPYCWEPISMLVEAGILEQEYVEDCEICCNPIQILASSSNDAVIDFSIDKML